MIYVGNLNLDQGHSEAEAVAAAIANNVPLTVGQVALLTTELLDPKYSGVSLAAVMIELSKSTYGAGEMPRPYCTPGEFMVVRSRASKIANAPGATAPQTAVWAQFADPSASMSDYESIDLTLADVRGGLDACLAVGLISENDYNALIWQDSPRTVGWVEATFGPGYVLMPSDLEGLV